MKQGPHKAKSVPAPPSQSASLLERLAAWRDSHLYSLVSSLGRLIQRPWATALTAGAMGIALSLPLGLLLALTGLEALAGGIGEARDLGLFLKPAVTAAEAGTLAQSLRQRADVSAVTVRSAEEGLAEFRQLAEFSGALQALDYNPLPALLVVTPAANADLPRLAAELGTLPPADFVQDNAAWRERLNVWLAFGRHAVGVVALLLGLGALLVVGNTVRLDIQARAEEIAIVQLLGATDGFVRRPFLYLGAWYGLAAGLLALVLAIAAQRVLAGPLAALSESYGDRFSTPGLDFVLAIKTLALAVIVGWCGAWLGAGHHLRAGRAGVFS